MCGICGIFGDPSTSAAEAMVAALRHRGPDDCGTFQDHAVVLGHARLSIIDVSARGHQPMRNEDGSVSIVFNGEAYGFADTRRRLEALGHRFASDSDTEVVLRLYEQYGDAFAEYLRGIFACAIYDRRRGGSLSPARRPCSTSAPSTASARSMPGSRRSSSACC
ncbi:MAG TPA: hypothetical protein VFL83_21515 [Anaeromyxobacter sp.]|nr:hypothetical protein [Anaeromyxobacter sp.]